MSTTGLTTCTTLAPGATRFGWQAPGDRGDGLLVDMDIASTRWRDVADVLLWPTPVEPTTASACAAELPATLAVVATQPGTWLVLTFSPTRVVTHQATVCAEDWPALLAVIVERYRAVVAERDRRRRP